MTDDLAKTLREIADFLDNNTETLTFKTLSATMHRTAADEIERLRQLIESTYWSARAVLENISDCVPSPNEIYGYVNELRDDISWIEKVLDIKNPMTDD